LGGLDIAKIIQDIGGISLHPFTRVPLFLMGFFLCTMVAYPLYYAWKLDYTEGKLQDAVIAHGKKHCNYDIESVNIDIDDMIMGGSSWSAKTLPAYEGIWGETTHPDGYIELYGFGECEMEELPYILTKRGEFKVPANDLTNRDIVYDVSMVDRQDLVQSNFKLVTHTDQFSAVITSVYLFLVGLIGFVGLLLYYVTGLISTMIHAMRDKSS